MIRKIGLKTGDVVMVHSSLDQFEGFDGKATDIIAILQAVVGPGGTILMPTIPFAGTAFEYISSSSMFDVARTPSRMGMITEIFRRIPGVLRSTHPTHSVAAWGARVDELLRDHYLAVTPCGENSPYARLTKVDGKILLLGVGIEAMTFFHAMEEELEPLMPFSPFTKEKFDLRARGLGGVVVMTSTRLFDPVVSGRRNLRVLVPELKRRGHWHEGNLGSLVCLLLNAQDVAQTCREMARIGRFCYD